MGGVHSSNYIKKESNADRNKTTPIKEYLNKTKAYLKNIINKLKKADVSKIYLTRAINFISSKHTDEERKMHSKDNNIELMIYDKADDV